MLILTKPVELENIDPVLNREWFARGVNVHAEIGTG